MNGVLSVVRFGQDCMRLFNCQKCGHLSVSCTLKQVEEHYYTYHIDTKQLEDCHGDENVLFRKFFCEECNTELGDEVAV